MRANTQIGQYRLVLHTLGDSVALVLHISVSYTNYYKPLRNLTCYLQTWFVDVCFFFFMHQTWGCCTL